MTAQAVRQTAVCRTGGSGRGTHDTVVVETPVALVLNGISHAVMMATPADLDDFALGFLLSEGLLADAAECYGIDTVPGERGIEVHVEIASSAAVRLKARRRTLEGRTGCGLCGIESLASLDLTPERLQPPPWLQTLSARTVLRAIAELPNRQPLNAATGACHAAAWVAADGGIADVAEDVGRHNALDKLLGRRARQGLANAGGFVIISSRASHELVRKCARLGVPALATISGPTSLAIEVAHAAGMRLFGFCRGDQAVEFVPAPEDHPV